MKAIMNGSRFGHWTVLSYAYTDQSGHKYMNCICDCGAEKIVRLSKLTAGESMSCGCCRREKYMNGAYENGKRTRLYNSWLAMRGRCHDKANNRYINYGGRGIKVCEQWADFKAFKQWATKNGYVDGMSLDRIDANKGYYPDNCRWADRTQQANNTRKNKYVFINGSYLTISETARLLGMKYSNLYFGLRSKEGRGRIASILKDCKEKDLIPISYNELKKHDILPLIEVSQQKPF